MTGRWVRVVPDDDKVTGMMTDDECDAIATAHWNGPFIHRTEQAATFERAIIRAAYARGVAQGREDAAKVCDELAHNPPSYHPDECCRGCAAAIRGQG